MVPLVWPQTDDLARMYRLFQRIPKGLDPVAEIFKEHVDTEGMKLVKEVRTWSQHAVCIETWRWM